MFVFNYRAAKQPGAVVFRWFCFVIGFEPSSYTWVKISILYNFTNTSSVIFKLNRPQHPDVYVHYLSWQHTDWVYCTAEARYTTLVYTTYTVAMEKINTDGFRASLWSHSANIHAMRLTLSSIQSYSHPQTTEQKSFWAAVGRRCYVMAIFFAFVSSWEPSRMQCCEMSFLCTNIQGCSMNRDHSIHAYYRTLV